MTNFKIFLFIYLNIIVAYAVISDQRLCANEDCSEPISLAKTIISYASDDARILSFKSNMVVTILSKSAGSRLDLWGAKINGRRGYIPVKFVKETNIFKQKPTFLKSTDEAPSNTPPTTRPVDSVPISSENKGTPVQDRIKPNSVSPPYEVLDGTTIYSNPTNESYSTSTITPESTDDVNIQQSKSVSSENRVEQTEAVTPDPKAVVDNLNNQKTLNSPEQVKISQETQNPISTESTNFSKEDDKETEEDDTETEEDEVDFEEEETLDDNEEASVETVKENSVDITLENEVNISKQSSNSSDNVVSPNAHIETSNATVIPDPKEVHQPEVGRSPEIAEKIDNAKPIEDAANKVANSENIKSSEVPGNTVVTNRSTEAVDYNFKKSTETSKNLKKSDEVTNNTVELHEVTSNNSQTPEVAPGTNQTPEVAPNMITPETAPNINTEVSPEGVPNTFVPALAPDTNQTPKVAPGTNQTPEVAPNMITPETAPNINTEVSPEGVPNTFVPELAPGTNQTSETPSNMNQSTEDVLNTVKSVEVVPSTNTPENANTLKSDGKLHEDNQNTQLPTVENKTSSDTVLVENEAIANADVDESQQVAKPTDYNNNNFYTGVPSGFQNSLNRLSKVSEDVLNIEQRDNSQVPSSDPYQPLNPTTESTIHEDSFPLDTETTFTENPLSANQEIQEDNKQIESVSEPIKSEELINESVNFDESTQVSGNLSYTEEVNNDLVFDEIQPEESMTMTKNEDQTEMNYENDEKSTTEPTDEIVSNEPGIFYKMYSSLFGASSETVTVEESINSDEKQVENNVVEEMKEEIQVSVLEEKIEDPTNMHSYSPFWKHPEEKPAEKYLPPSNEAFIADKIPIEMQSCDATQNPSGCSIQNDNTVTEQQNSENIAIEFPENVYSIFLYLSLTAVTVLLFSLGHYYIERKRKDGTLIASINNLEKKLLITTKECLLAQDELRITKDRLTSIEDSSFGSNEMVTALKDEIEEFKTIRTELEEQNSNLEKELENATEAGMELNIMLREILSTQSGNEHLMQNIDHLQKQLNEQQLTINTMNTSLGVKNTENELLQTELSLASEKIAQLQAELNKMVVNVLSVQEDKTKSETDYENQIQKIKSEFRSTSKNLNSELNVLKNDNKQLQSKIEEIQRSLDLKMNEYQLLKEGMKDVQAVQSNKDSLKALLSVSKVKAEVQQLRGEKHKLSEKLQEEAEAKQVFEKEVQVMMQEVQILKDKFDEAERDKIEAQTRLEVLSSYFNDKEAQLQKEINENESKWIQKEGEATSTIERIKWIQEELQNYKSQNELLKKEILDQEVSLKSQISMLEKKSHDNWLLARQSERRVEESKQEASQLRNRLTIVEKNLNNSSQLADETKLQNRILLPLESNGELPVSPLHLSNVDNSGSPPLLYPHRDHMTTSPPIPGLPLPPFLPPPLGGFMPPPMPGVPPFMPPPPALFPGDHRPPPLGRMSSPPLHGRYSPDSRTYSPYDRDDSPPMSPTYPDSDYRRRSPPPPSHMQRNYSPYHSKGRSSQWDEDRDYRGPPQHRNKIRNRKGPGMSSGSGNSNESLENSGRHSGRV